MEHNQDKRESFDSSELYMSETFENEKSDKNNDFSNAPLKYKIIALATALLFPLGSHFSGSALAAVKGPLIEKLAIDNTKYGVISASVSIINTILPIAGGIFIDMFGSIWGTLAVNSAIVLGSLFTALAAKFQSFPLMVVARISFGLGSGLIVTMQESSLSKWFRTKHLSVVIGIQLSVSRLSTFLGTLIANPIAEATGDWVWTFWLSFLFCCFSIGMNFIYAFVTWRLQGKVGLDKNERMALKHKKNFRWSTLFKFPVIYWHIILIEFVYAAVWSSFQTISTDLIKKHFGTTQVLAGYKASASQTVPIVATPILGIIMELYGFRITVLLFSSIFLILSSGLLGWTTVDPVIGMVFYSISLAFGPISMITSIGMLLPSEYIGTGLGIYKSSNNIGTSILDVAVGVVQDKTKNQSYANVMIVFIVLASIGFVIITALWISQRVFWGNILECNRTIRTVLMDKIYAQENNSIAQGLNPFYSNQRSNFISWIFIVLFILALLAAWVLFFVFSIHPSKT